MPCFCLLCDIMYGCFFVNDTATTEIYTYLHTLSLHDALPICLGGGVQRCRAGRRRTGRCRKRLLARRHAWRGRARSEEHTSELQSLMRISYAVFCLKKKNKQHRPNTTLTPKIHNNQEYHQLHTNTTIN